MRPSIDGLQERSGPGFGVGLIARKKPHMPAGIRHFEGNVLRPVAGIYRIAPFGEERIIYGIEQQRRHPDFWKEGPG